MITAERTMQTGEHAEWVRVAARRVYDAECALHVAHQTHVDAWISAASEKLHQAVVEYLTAANSAEAQA